VARVEEVAPGVLRIAVMPFDAINVYHVGDLLIDSGVRASAGAILRAVADLPVRAHALTHAHPDHQGSSRRICRQLGVPFWCGEGDREAAETGDFTKLYPSPRSRFAALQARLWGGPGHPVARVLSEGDTFGGFQVLETPGHTPGHLSFWREPDRVLILGDVIFGMNPFTLRTGVREPFAAFTPDPAENRRSARRLAALRPAVVCFGHGPPLRDPDAFAAFVSSLT